MKKMNYKELHSKYTPLISRLVRRYPKEYREDLNQEASIALFRAFEVWDSSKAAFITLAYKCIRIACSNYMADKARLVRTPKWLCSQGKHVDCESLDQLVTDNFSLESLFGVESKEDLIDLSITVWDQLKRLADKNVISWHEFSLIYFRYFQQYSYKKIAFYFDCTENVVQHRIPNIIRKIRPYFLGIKRI